MLLESLFEQVTINCLPFPHFLPPFTLSPVYETSIRFLFTYLRPIVSGWMTSQAMSCETGISLNLMRSRSLDSTSATSLVPDSSVDNPARSTTQSILECHYRMEILCGSDESTTAILFGNMGLVKES